MLARAELLRVIGAAVGAEFVDAVLSFTGFNETLFRFDLFVVFLDRLISLSFSYPPWNSRTIRAPREK
jgi:hypothetical protein